MKALVTGGAGFIGSHLVDALVARGDEVVVIDDFSSGGYRNLPNLPHHVYKLDVCEESPMLDYLMRVYAPEVVFHLAAQVSVSASTREPEKDIRDNLIGTVRVADACVRHGVKTLVFASSAAIYGDPETLPAPEGASLSPMSPYAIDKCAAELYLRYFAERKGLGIRILRLANVYGPRQDPHGEAGVVAIFVATMLKEEPVTVFGDGSQGRDFVYVKDVARAFVLAVDADDMLVANIGGGTLTRIKDLVNTIAPLCEHTGLYQKMPPRPGDVQDISLNAARAKRYMGWEPTISLAAGLRATVAAFRKAATR